MPGTRLIGFAEDASPHELIQQFAGSPGLAGIAMRKALDRTPGRLLEAVIRDTAQGTQSRGFRYALMLLRDAGMLVAALAQPASMSFEQACRITGTMLETDPAFAGLLLDAALTRRDLSDTACRLRILDLIGKFPERVTSWRPVVKLYERGNAQVKARSAALLARHNYREDAAQARFEEADIRGRAELVGALPSGAGRPVRELLVQSLSDSNNRVAGNACLNLYRTGDLRALTTLARMIEKGTPAERLTAAWVMGEVRDLRFGPLLRRAAATDDPDLRRRAFRSLGALERPEGSPVSGLRIIPVSHTCKGEFNELWVFVFGSDEDHFIPALRPVDFIAGGLNDAIIDYSVEAPAPAVPVLFRAGLNSRCGLPDCISPASPALQTWNITPFGASPAIGETSCPFGRPLAWVYIETNNKGRHLAVLQDETSKALDFRSWSARCEASNVQLHVLVSPPETCVPEQAIAWFIEAFKGRYVIRTPANLPVTSIMLRDSRVVPASFSIRNSVSVPKEVS